MRVLFSQGLIAISKPRCGSTSVRRMLDKLVDIKHGDIAVDVAGQRPPFHPHHTAPYLKQLLIEQGYDIDGMTTFIITRNPVDMLWSYFNFFKPDGNSCYNYSADWKPDQTMNFEDWIMRGRVGMNAQALALAPNWVSTSDLTPLSLEAHVDNRQGIREVDLIFRIEEIDRFAVWLSERTGIQLAPRHVNGSGSSEIPHLSESHLDRIRQQFPLETKMYGF